MVRSAGLRVTRPRVAVLAAVHERPHADTDSLIGDVRSLLPAVSHQAVYDGLAALTRAGLLRRIQPAGSVARYEARIGDNHHHLVCRTCGVIVDVDCADGGGPVPARLRGPRLRHRRGRGRLLGPLPRLPRRGHDRRDRGDHRPLTTRAPTTEPPNRTTDRSTLTEQEMDDRDRPAAGRDRAGQREREPRDRRPDPQGDPSPHEQGLVARAARPVGPPHHTAEGRPARRRASATPRR